MRARRVIFVVSCGLVDLVVAVRPSLEVADTPLTSTEKDDKGEWVLTRNGERADQDRPNKDGAKLAKPQKCKHLLADPMRDFCMVAAGRNPKITTGPTAGKEWYGTPEWEAVKKGPSWCKYCFTCEVTGHYEGVLEDAIMVSSKRPKADFGMHSLKVWCEQMGASMDQDSVLVREAPLSWLHDKVRKLNEGSTVHLEFTYGATKGQDLEMSCKPYSVDPKSNAVMFSQVTPTWGLGFEVLSEKKAREQSGADPDVDAEGHAVTRQPFLQRANAANFDNLNDLHLNASTLGPNTAK